MAKIILNKNETAKYKALYYAWCEAAGVKPGPDEIPESDRDWVRYEGDDLVWEMEEELFIKVMQQLTDNVSKIYRLWSIVDGLKAQIKDFVKSIIPDDVRATVKETIDGLFHMTEDFRFAKSLTGLSMDLLLEMQRNYERDLERENSDALAIQDVHEAVVKYYERRLMVINREIANRVDFMIDPTPEEVAVFNGMDDEALQAKLTELRSTIPATDPLSQEITEERGRIHGRMQVISDILNERTWPSSQDGDAQRSPE